MNTTNGFVISNGVLKDYRGLESNVVIPDGVEVIGPSAFTERSGIQSISFPHTLNTIGSYAFYNCSDLESVSLPDGLVEIGNYAFGKCKKLKNIAIPDSVVYFGEGFLLFCYCDITTNIWPSQLSHAIEDYEIRGIHILMIIIQSLMMTESGLAMDMIGDKRNYLYKLYAKFLQRYRPKFFVFENVAGLLSAKEEDGSLHFDNMRELFKACGYSTEYSVLNASHYGVLQNRKII